MYIPEYHNPCFADVNPDDARSIISGLESLRVEQNKEVAKYGSGHVGCVYRRSPDMNSVVLSLPFSDMSSFNEDGTNLIAETGEIELREYFSEFADEHPEAKARGEIYRAGYGTFIRLTLWGKTSLPTEHELSGSLELVEGFWEIFSALSEGVVDDRIYSEVMHDHMMSDVVEALEGMTRGVDVTFWDDVETIETKHVGDDYESGAVYVADALLYMSGECKLESYGHDGLFSQMSPPEKVNPWSDYNMWQTPKTRAGKRYLLALIAELSMLDGYSKGRPEIYIEEDCDIWG